MNSTFLFIPALLLTANCSSLTLCVSLVVSDDTALATLTGDCGIDLLLLLLLPLLLFEFILLATVMNDTKLARVQAWCVLNACSRENKIEFRSRENASDGGTSALLWYLYHQHTSNETTD